MTSNTEFRNIRQEIREAQYKLRWPERKQATFWDQWVLHHGAPIMALEGLKVEVYMELAMGMAKVPLFLVRKKTRDDIKALSRRNIRIPIKVLMGRLQGDLTRKVATTDPSARKEVREGMPELRFIQPIQEHIRITTVKKKMEHGAREHG